MNTHLKGRRSEQSAAEHCLRYAKAGTQLVERNWRCRHGEIDFILLEESTLAFVEVRWRQRDWALESIRSSKRRKIEHLARIYLAKYRGPASDVRFDVVVGRGSQWEWIRDAWRPNGY